MPKAKNVCAQYIPVSANLKESVTSLIKDETFSYIVTSLFHPGSRREEKFHSDRPLGRSCLGLESHEWNYYIVGETSRHIDVDSKDEDFRRQSEALLLQELHYAAYVNVSAVIIHLNSLECVNLANVLNAWLIENTHMHIWVNVPIENPQISLDRYLSNVGDREHESPWEWWNRLRCICGHSIRLGVVLDVGADLPHDADRARWLAEPVRALWISTSLFLTNRRGYPVLSTAHQFFFRAFADFGTQVILVGPNRHQSIVYYAQYVNYLWNLNSKETQDGGDYSDLLQIPLQPLMNNLEAQTYEVFEKDPVKYKNYQCAIYQALLDRVPEDSRDTTITVIMVMGAGRGPLVRCALDAADEAGCQVRVYAVEKNPYAVITLQCRRDEEWKERVTVVACDMRCLNLADKADILVSELLGSFGDNELSPECLDGAQEFLKDDGISIPCDYTSFLCPVMSHKLYTEARACPVEPGKAATASLEMAYVVLQKNKLFLDKPVPLFTFHHPNRDANINNSRYADKTFTVSENCIVHGFSGFFEATLYKQHKLSIVPETFSNGMFSWFPIYFPITDPISLKAGMDLTVHFWRRVGHRDVWYEWTVSDPVALPIHNANGRAFKIGL